MNAVRMLTQEHDEVKAMFKEFEEAGEKANRKKREIAEKVFKELHAHTQIEEQIFYPAFRGKAGKEGEKLVLEAIEEHRVADFVMERLQNGEGGDETFDAKFKVLMESVLHHIREEEKEMFPEARKVLAGGLDRLGEEMEQLHQQLE